MDESATAKTVEELAVFLGNQFAGDGQIMIERVASFESAGSGEVAYVEDQKALDEAVSPRASCLIVSEFVASSRKERAASLAGVLIEVAKPKLAFALIAALLHPQKRREPFVHPSAVIAESADIDLTVFIGPHVAIGEGTRIGAGTRIEAGVVIGDHVQSVATACFIPA